MAPARGEAPSTGQRLSRDFLDMTAAERGAAKNTLDAYARDLADYTGFLAARGADPLSADTDAVRAFLADLDARGLMASSAARKLSCVRQFHRFLYAEGRRGDDPAAIIEGPRQGRPLPKVLSVAEVDKLLAVAAEGIADPARPLAERMRAARMTCLLETLYATGLRVSELIALPRRAANARDPFITIRGKGGRERLTPLSAGAIQSMRAWLDLLGQLNPALAEGPWLFPSDSESGHLTRQAFARDLQALAGAAGIPSARVSPHVLRHAFAS
ncbi:MAG: tyrosine-type recombinase/integrase, partial [Beijerinckiaceae bacterium]|nr:tyrosine-type recombinase/integrase [Beijerinckiaceae bacterium]